MPYAHMTLLEDELSDKHEVVTICPPSLVAQVRGVFGCHVSKTYTPTYQPALDAAANDIAHGDDNSGNVEEKPLNLPTA